MSSVTFLSFLSLVTLSPDTWVGPRVLLGFVRPPVMGAVASAAPCWLGMHGKFAVESRRSDGTLLLDGLEFCVGALPGVAAPVVVPVLGCWLGGQRGDRRRSGPNGYSVDWPFTMAARFIQ